MSPEIRLDWFGVWGLIFLLLVFWSVYRMHRDNSVAFNLFDLILEGGKLSKIAVCFMSAFLVTTWVIIYITLAGKLTEGYFIAYGGMWVTALVARVVSVKPTPPGGGVAVC